MDEATLETLLASQEEVQRERDRVKKEEVRAKLEQERAKEERARASRMNSYVLIFTVMTIIYLPASLTSVSTHNSYSAYKSSDQLKLK